MLKYTVFLSLIILILNGCILMEKINKPAVPNYESIKNQKGNKADAYNTKIMIVYNPREPVPGKSETYQSLKMGRGGKPYPAVDRQFWDPIFGRSTKAGSTYGGWVTMNNMKYGMMIGGALCLLGGGIYYAIDPPATYDYGSYQVTTIPIGAIGLMIGGGICLAASIFINAPESWLKQAVDEYNDYAKRDLKLTYDDSLTPQIKYLTLMPGSTGYGNKAYYFSLMSINF